MSTNATVNLTQYQTTRGISPYSGQTRVAEATNDDTGSNTFTISGVTGAQYLPPGSPIGDGSAPPTSGGSDSAIANYTNGTNANNTNTDSTGEIQSSVAGTTTSPSSSTTGTTPSVDSAANSLTSTTQNNIAQCVAQSMTDPRIRISAYPNQASALYGTGNGIMNIMNTTGGLLFPYTPSISHSISVDYSSISNMHANQDYRIFNTVRTTKISITGQFTSQNQAEAQYSLAVIHFVRTMTKMYFGKRETISNRGLPPPVLLLHGYGNLMYGDIPVIMLDASWNFDKDVDYVDYSGPCGSARVPILWQLTLSLEIQNTPKRWRDEFLLDDFRSGALLSSNTTRQSGLGGGWF